LAASPRRKNGVNVRLSIAFRCMRGGCCAVSPNHSLMQFQSLDGVLLVDKAKGMTSHDVVAIVRRRLGIKKVGHCGTLDPLATGLLLVVIGRGTKIQDLLMAEDKEYVGTLTLGVETDSQDADGKVVATKPVPDLSREQIEA